MSRAALVFALLCAIAAPSGAQAPKSIDPGMSEAKVVEHIGQLRPPREHQWVELAGELGVAIRRIADLPDRRSLCVVTRPSDRAVTWIVCRLDDEPAPQSAIEMIPGRSNVRDEPSEIPMLGGSLAAILDAALASGGDIDHLAVGRLGEWLASARS